MWKDFTDIVGSELKSLDVAMKRQFKKQTNKQKANSLSKIRIQHQDQGPSGVCRTKTDSLSGTSYAYK